MKSLARSFVWWPEMDKVVKQCNTCQCTGHLPASASSLTAVGMAKYPWVRLHADYAGPYFWKCFLF